MENDVFTYIFLFGIRHTLFITKINKTIYIDIRPAEFESTQTAWKAASLPLTYGRLYKLFIQYNIPLLYNAKLYKLAVL